MTDETVADPPAEPASPAMAPHTGRNGDGYAGPAARKAPIQLRPAAAEALGQLRKVVVWLTIGTVAVIGLGIVFEVLSANNAKWIVSFVDDLAKWLAAPFDEMFTPSSEKLAIAINWGIAIGVYATLGGLLARALGRLSGAVR